MESLAKLAFVGQLFACFFMTGVIWIIQLIQYPGFMFASRDRFVHFHTFHSRRITFVVGPTMLLELLTAAVLFLAVEQNALVMAVNLASVMLLWALTFFVSVPIHNRLALGFDEKLVRRLTVTNWYRTALWTLRSALLFCFLTFGIL